MKNWLWLFLLFPFFLFSQRSAFNIHIDSISSTDIPNGERKYKLVFSLHNSSKKPVSILLRPTQFSSIQYGSMTNSVHYKIYEDDRALDLGDAFDRPDRDRRQRITIDVSDPDKIEAAKKQLRENFHISESAIEEYIKTGTVKDSTIRYRERDILSEITTLKPGETQLFEQIFFWDKQPYFKYDENEFYLDFNKPHYIELVVMSTREPFKNQMSGEDFAKLEAIPNFLSGVFVSNRVIIDFSKQ